MSVLNTFFIKYVSNAKEVIQGNEEISRSTKKTARDLKNTDEVARDTGKTFADVIDKISGFAAAYAGFNYLKTGITQTAQFNAGLKTQADLLQVTTQSLKAYGQAAEAAGGSAEGARAGYVSRQMANVEAGLGVVDPITELRSMRNILAGRTNPQKQRLLSQYGFTDLGQRHFLSQASDEEFESFLKDAMEKNKITEKQGEESRSFVRSLSNFKASVSSGFTSFNSAILGGISSSLNKLSESPTASVGSGLLASILGALGLGGAAKSVLTGTGLARLGMGILGRTGVIGGSLYTGGMIGYHGLGLFSKKIEELLVKRMNGDVQPPSLSGATRTGNSDLDFWMGQGYTPAQAAAIMANIHHESAGKADARGDGGMAHGLFQWHPDRRANIFKNTGIDVSSATYEEQMKAAAWEMKHGRPGFDDTYFRSLQNPADAAAYFSQKFEAPANGAYQSLIRGRTALSLAERYSASGMGGGGTVNIDKVEIVTQATDAAGIAQDIREHLKSELSILAANNDDGRAY